MLYTKNQLNDVSDTEKTQSLSVGLWQSGTLRGYYIRPSEALLGRLEGQKR